MAASASTQFEVSVSTGARTASVRGSMTSRSERPNETPPSSEMGLLIRARARTPPKGVASGPSFTSPRRAFMYPPKTPMRKDRWIQS